MTCHEAAHSMPPDDRIITMLGKTPRAPLQRAARERSASCLRSQAARNRRSKRRADGSSCTNITTSTALSAWFEQTQYRTWWSKNSWNKKCCRQCRIWRLCFQPTETVEGEKPVLPINQLLRLLVFSGTQGIIPSATNLVVPGTSHERYEQLPQSVAVPRRGSGIRKLTGTLMRQFSSGKVRWLHWGKQVQTMTWRLSCCAQTLLSAWRRRCSTSPSTVLPTNITKRLWTASQPPLGCKQKHTLFMPVHNRIGRLRYSCKETGSKRQLKDFVQRRKAMRLRLLRESRAGVRERSNALFLRLPTHSSTLGWRC
eukprot:m.1055556 g.1055556  ORF g.1055556 m.1055556 type:complete len:312 (+) comp24193_c0_seq1:549-1484(+)